MDLRKISLSAIERELMEWPELKMINQDGITFRAHKLLCAIEAADLEIEERFSEIRLDMDMRNRPE